MQEKFLFPTGKGKKTGAFYKGTLFLRGQIYYNKRKSGAHNALFSAPRRQKNRRRTHFPRRAVVLYCNGKKRSGLRREVRQIMVNKVRVTIAGSPYVISSTDSEAYVTGLAGELDASIQEVMAANPNLSVTRAAVFCALDYLDRMKKSTGSADNMRNQIKDYLADAARAKLDAEEAKRDVERLKREVQQLKERSAGR